MTDASLSQLTSGAYEQALKVIESVEPRIAAATRQELADQRGSLKLIASENYASPAVLLDDGHLVQRQVRRGDRRAPLLRRVPERRHGRVARRRACARALRGAVRLRPAALGHRRQPGRLLVDPGQPGGVALPREDARQERQRAERGRLGVVAPRVRQPATAGDVAGRRRAPDPRVPAQHQRQDVPPAAVRHRPRRPDCWTTTRSPPRRASSSRSCWSPATRPTPAA